MKLQKDKSKIYVFYSAHKIGDFSLIEKMIFLGQKINFGYVAGFSHTGIRYWDKVSKCWILMHSRGTGLQLTKLDVFLKSRDIIYEHSFNRLQNTFSKIWTIFLKYNDRPYDNWSIINFVSRVLIHRNLIKTRQDEALFCSEFVCIVVKSLLNVNIPKLRKLKSREYVSPLEQFACLDCIDNKFNLIMYKQGV